MKVKQLAVAVACAGLIGSQASFATEELSVENSLTNQELNFVFQDTQSIELASLSSTEMDETEGAWFWNAMGGIFGGLGGMFGAGSGYLMGGGDSPYGFANATLSGLGEGALVGAINPVSIPVNTLGTYTAGYISGAGSSYFGQ